MAGKRALEGGYSGQCAGFGDDFQGARDAKWAQQRFNGGGCDGKGPLFVLYPGADLPCCRQCNGCAHFHRDQFGHLLRPGTVDAAELFEQGNPLILTRLAPVIESGLGRSVRRFGVCLCAERYQRTNLLVRGIDHLKVVRLNWRYPLPIDIKIAFFFTMIDSVLCDGFSPPQDLPSAGCASCSSCCHSAINFGKGATFGLASTKLVWSHRHMQIIPLLFKLAH